MKRTLITVILIISICVSLKAQIYLGAKGGVAVASFSNMKKEIKPSTGYKVGLSFQYMFTDFGVESGAYIKQVGINDSKGILPGKNSDFIPVSMEVQPKYFELPISLVYKYKLAGNLKLCINGGGYLSYGYGGGGIISYSTGGYGINAFDAFVLKNDQDFQNFHSEGANEFDYGLIAGVGLEFLGINVNANYDFGLGEVYNKYPISQLSKNIKNRVFWIGLGYSIKL